MTRTATIRRALLVVFVLAVVWAVVVAFTGGFFWQIGPLRISSRDARRPLQLAIAAALAALVFAGPPWIRSGLSRGWEWVQPALRPLGRLRHGGAEIAAVAIAIAAILIDVYQWSGAPTLWLDEEMIALNVRDRSFSELSGALWLEQSAPYGWLVLQRAVLLTLGDSELALRLVPLVFGAATVLGALWVGRRWLGAVGMPALVLLCWLSQWLSHYRFEVKHYTADVFFSLMLPALVVWAIEGDSVRQRVRRAVIWWATAAAGQWLANGATLVTPGCALVLLAALWRRDGWRAAGAAVAGGVLWLAALAAHYELSLRFTAHLRDYWSDQFPPESIGAAGLVLWFVNRLELLAANPAGTSLWLSLWLLAVAGLAVGGAGRLGAAFATVPVSALAYAMAGFVPLYHRFSIWIVPALYVGVMLVADRAVRSIRPAWEGHRWGRLAVWTLTLLLTFQLVRDVATRGYYDLDIPHPREKQALNDRAAVRSLMAQRRPGDTLITTRLGWPAIWWYGRISIADGSEAEDRPEGYEMTYVPPGPECRPPALLGTLPHTRRLLVYLGFPDVPDDFEGVLRQSLDQVGVTTGYHKFAGIGRLFVVDLERRPLGATPVDSENLGAAAEKLHGCVAIKPLRRR